MSPIVGTDITPEFFDAGDEEDLQDFSPRDAASLLALCVEADEIDFAIVNGISNHRHGRLDLEGTRRLLGFEPQDGTSFPRAGTGWH